MNRLKTAHDWLVHLGWKIDKQDEYIIRYCKEDRHHLTNYIKFAIPDRKVTISRDDGYAISIDTTLAAVVARYLEELREKAFCLNEK